jgi:maleamate amidohydrolase
LTSPRPWDGVISPEEEASYEKAGWGGSVGFGEKPALVVVDMYRAFVDPDYPFSGHGALTTAGHIKKLLEIFREGALPVFFTTAPLLAALTPAARGRWKARATTASALMQSQEAFDLWPDLGRRDDEPIIVKTYPSAFFGTTLASQLIYHRVDTLVVAGTVTSGCVRGTCLDGFNYNYHVIVPEECVCDRGEVSHKVALFEIQMKYGDVLPLAEVEQRLRRISDRAATSGALSTN